MSIEHMAIVLHHSKAKGTAKLVLLGIANHAGDGGAWPTIATLAKYANVEPRAVRKVLAKLQSLGEVIVHVQAGGTIDQDDYGRPNRYDVMIQCPVWCDHTPHHRDTRRRTGQPALWTDPRSARTPPVQMDTTPRSIGTGGLLSARTAKPSIEPSNNSGSAALPELQTAREPEPDCDECWLSADECRARRAVSGHAYTPRPQVAP